MPLHPDVERLAVILTEMSALLRRYDNTVWATRIDRCRHYMERSDFFGVAQLLEMFGGMGSLNDVVLQRDGVMPRDDNERFDALRAEAGELAAQFAREERDRVRGV